MHPGMDRAEEGQRGAWGGGHLNRGSRVAGRTLGRSRRDRDGVAGLKSINSTSSQGGTNITLQFDLSRNIDAAAQDVQSQIARTARQLASA